MLAKQIEEASLNAWPALNQMVFDGWLLRFARGYTRRANSVNLLYPSQLPLEEKIIACEHIYQAQNIPLVFRINPTSEGQGIEAVLTKRGYHKIDITQVMCLNLKNFGPSSNSAKNHPGVSLESLSVETWLAHFSRLSEAPPEKHDIHERILQNIIFPAQFLTLKIENEVVACGLGVLERSCLGLFDIVTAPAWRRKGFAAQTVEALLAWGKKNGALHAYLQVVRGNAPAQALYSNLGFKDLYPYWYWVKK